jgi:hypothetical protein
VPRKETVGDKMVVVSCGPPSTKSSSEVWASNAVNCKQELTRSCQSCFERRGFGMSSAHIRTSAPNWKGRVVDEASSGIPGNIDRRLASSCAVSLVTSQCVESRRRRDSRSSGGSKHSDSHVARMAKINPIRWNSVGIHKLSDDNSPCKIGKRSWVSLAPRSSACACWPHVKVTN